MKKLLIIVTMFLLIIPTIVMAEECDSSKISIGSLKLVDSSNDNVEVSDASIVDNKIKVDLKFSDVDDYAQYSFVIKNDSDEDYELSDKSIDIDSDYIDYTLSTNDNLNIIKAGEEKTVLLNIKYSKEVDSSSFKDGSYTESKIMNLNYSYDKKSNPIADIIENPKTGAFKYFLVLVALIVFALLIIKERKKSKVMLLLLVLGLIPISINALCTCNISVESNVVIEKSTPRLLTFKYVYSECEKPDINFDFEYEEGMTIGEWLNSEYFKNAINAYNEKVIEKELMEEFPDLYYNRAKSDIISAIITGVIGPDSIRYDANNEIIIDNNIRDYYIKESDIFTYAMVCYN